MKHLFIFAAVLFPILTGTVLAKSLPASDAEMAKAFRLAYAGELTDGVLVHAIEARFETTVALNDRVQSAYLLTFAPRRLLTRRAMEYVEFVLQNSQSEELLGKEALFRLYRLRGDEFFEAGKFKLAAQDHERLLVSTNAMLRDYAVLKVGWSYLNLKNPTQAFEFWLSAVEMGLHEKANLSPNLLHGLGLALVEAGAGSSQFIPRLSQLSLDHNQLLQFSLGIDEGLDSVTQEAAVEALTRQLSQLRWKKELSEVFFENLRIGGKRACRLLPLLTLNSPLWKRDGKILEACSQWVSRPGAEKSAAAMITHVENLLGQSELHGPERRVRFEFAVFRRNEGRACLEGIQWLTESSAAAPVKKIAKTCHDSEDVLAVIAEIEKGAAQPGFLKSEKDPLLFVFTSTLNQAVFRREWAKQITKSPDKYRPTLAPSLLAESLKTNQEMDSAGALLEGFGYQPDGTLRPEAIWENLLAFNIQSEVSSAQGARAMDKLSRALPLDSTRPLTSADFELWLATLNRLKGNATLKEPLAQAAQKLITGRTFDDNPSSRAALLEIAGEFGLWAPIWERLSRDRANSKMASEKFKLLFFEAIADGKFNPPAFKTESPEINFLAELGNDFHERRYPEAFKLDPKSKSVLSKDLQWLRNFDLKRADALGPKVAKRDRITQVTTWVKFVDQNGRGLKSRTWTSSRLYDAGTDLLSGFCREANERLESLQTVSKRRADNQEQWNTVVPLLQKKFRECQAGNKGGTHAS